MTLERCGLWAWLALGVAMMRLLTAQSQSSICFAVRSILILCMTLFNLYRLRDTHGDMVLHVPSGMSPLRIGTCRELRNTDTAPRACTPDCVCAAERSLSLESPTVLLVLQVTVIYLGVTCLFGVFLRS